MYHMIYSLKVMAHTYIHTAQTQLFQECPGPGSQMIHRRIRFGAVDKDLQEILLGSPIVQQFLIDPVLKNQKHKRSVVGP